MSRPIPRPAPVTNATFESHIAGNSNLTIEAGKPSKNCHLRNRFARSAQGDTVWSGHGVRGPAMPAQQSCRVIVPELS